MCHSEIQLDGQGRLAEEYRFALRDLDVSKKVLFGLGI